MLGATDERPLTEAQRAGYGVLVALAQRDAQDIHEAAERKAQAEREAQAERDAAWARRRVLDARPL
jgi:hypothetical protein